jgi:hypothetical protein
MPQDILEITEAYLSEDPVKWGKLSSDIRFRRLQILLLREILAEIRQHNQDR